MRLLFFTVGILYLAKQFTSLLILLFILFFMLKKRDRSYALFGVSGILIKEIASVTYFSNIIKNYHLQEVDFLDLVLDLILLRDLKINNIFEILYNLSKDKPHSYFLIVFLVLVLFNYLKFDSTFFENVLVVLIFLNFIFIFILYITLWQTMELESPIRYILNLLPTVLIYKLNVLEKFYKK